MNGFFGGGGFGDGCECILWIPLLCCCGAAKDKCGGGGFGNGCECLIWILLLCCRCGETGGFGNNNFCCK